MMISFGSSIPFADCIAATVVPNCCGDRRQRVPLLDHVGLLRRRRGAASGPGSAPGVGRHGVGLGVGVGVASATARRRRAASGSGSATAWATGVAVGGRGPPSSVEQRRWPPRRHRSRAPRRPRRRRASGRSRARPRAAGDAAPGRLRGEDHPRRDEAVAEAGAGPASHAAVAGGVREVALAALVRLGQAEPRLLLSLERGRGVLGVAAVRRVDAVDRRPAIPRPARGAGRRDPRPEDSNSPAGNRGATNEISRRRPIFPGGCPPSIFGAGELNFRVRDGNGWSLSASVTGIDLQLSTRARVGARRRVEAIDRRGRAARCRPSERDPAAC